MRVVLLRKDTQTPKENVKKRAFGHNLTSENSKFKPKGNVKKHYNVELLPTPSE